MGRADGAVGGRWDAPTYGFALEISISRFSPPPFSILPSLQGGAGGRLHHLATLALPLRYLKGIRDNKQRKGIPLEVKARESSFGDPSAEI